MGDDFGIREGEVAVALPDGFDAHLYFIGRVRTPWTRREQCPKNARESDAVCTLEIDPRFAAALTGVETCTHLLVLYWMDKSRRDLVLQAPRHYGELRGTFALRSPARPIRSRPAWRASSKSTAPGCPWSASTASTARRSSTSSRILPRPIRCLMPWWGDKARQD